MKKQSRPMPPPTRQKEVSGWKYYKHAAIPTTAPHETANTAPLKDGAIWSLGNGRRAFVILARWASDFDCEQETEWWYCIKDTPFDLNSIKSKRRYIIKQGIANFDLRCIDPTEYIDELFEVAKASFQAYPKKYRPSANKQVFSEDIKNHWRERTVYGAFEKGAGKLCGYAVLDQFEQYAAFSILKVIPEYEKRQINAALVYQILLDFNEKLSSGYYICDGERNILHETSFQDYLIKYFGFRRAYCCLHIKYHPGVRLFISLLYHFRAVLAKLDKNAIIHKVNAILAMEKISRKGVSPHTAA